MSEEAVVEVQGGPVMCSKYTDQTAIALFRWPWGEKGACGPLYQTELRMTAKNLKRQVEFSPLPVQPAALTLDERTQFHARIIALEEDGKQARARGLELYDSNKKLSEEIRRLRAQTPVLEGTISELRQELELAKRERFEAVADRAEAVAELQRLQDLTPSEEVEALRARVAHLEKVLQATEAHLAGEQKTTAMLGEQVDTLEAERNNLRAELAAARGQQ